jgi:hypothetical protein
MTTFSKDKKVRYPSDARGHRRRSTPLPRQFPNHLAQILSLITQVTTIGVYRTLITQEDQRPSRPVRLFKITIALAF